MEKLTGMWKQISKSGKTYYSAILREDVTLMGGVVLRAGSKFLLFQNQSENEKAPQLTLHFEGPADDARERPPLDNAEEDIPF